MRRFVSILELFRPLQRRGVVPAIVCGTQFLPLATSCVRPNTTGATAWTEGHSARMASTSVGVSDTLLPPPELTAAMCGANAAKLAL